MKYPATSIGWVDPRKQVGELLWPERFGPGEIEKLKKDLGSYGYASQFLQRPAPPEGGFIRRAWFRRWRGAGADGRVALLPPTPGDAPRHRLPADALRFASVDLAASTKHTADYTVACVWALWGRDLALLDVRRARLEGPDIVPMIRGLTKTYHLAFTAIERTGFQLALVQEARRDGVPVREIAPDRDKVSRALAAAPYMEAGHVFLPEEAPWLADLEHELLLFPNGTHDDQVDALVYGVLTGMRYAQDEAAAAGPGSADTYGRDGRDVVPGPLEGMGPSGSPFDQY